MGAVKENVYKPDPIKHLDTIVKIWDRILEKVHENWSDRISCCEASRDTCYQNYYSENIFQLRDLLVVITQLLNFGGFFDTGSFYLGD